MKGKKLYLIAIISILIFGITALCSCTENNKPIDNPTESISKVDSVDSTADSVVDSTSEPESESESESTSGHGGSSDSEWTPNY